MAQIGSITVSDRIKLQKLYNEKGPAAFSSINNLKASGISREKILQSKTLIRSTKESDEDLPGKMRMLAILMRFVAWTLHKWITYHDGTEVSTFYSLL